MLPAPGHGIFVSAANFTSAALSFCVLVRTRDKARTHPLINLALFECLYGLVWGCEATFSQLHRTRISCTTTFIVVQALQLGCFCFAASAALRLGWLVRTLARASACGFDAALGTT